MHRFTIPVSHKFILLASWMVALGSFAAAPPSLMAQAQQVPASPSVAEAIGLDQKLIAAAKTGSEIMPNLAYLSDIIGPRLTGSEALKRANEWTAEKMKSYGLANVHLEAWSIPLGWERGTASARLIEPSNGRSLTVAASGWSPSTKGRIEGDVVVMTARSSADLAPYKGKLKNAIVLQGPPSAIRPITETGMAAMFTTPPGTPARSMQNPERFYQQMMAFRRELNEFLRNEGALVVLRDAAKPHGLLNMGGSWGGRDRASAADPIPSLFVVHEHYAMLHRLATRPAPARTRVEVEISNKLTPGPIAVYNTVGEIRGSEKPDEVVILCAHLDSWDLGQGTTDNGTGSMVILEAARILNKCGVRPRRTIRFIHFTGEEQGLRGSEAYAQQHKDELPRISMCLAHDTGTGKVIGIGLQGREVIKPVLEKELVSLKPLGLTNINMRSMGGTDHASFERVGVPGFALQQDPAEYRFTHHSQSDTLDKAREPDLVQGAQVMAVIAMRVANLPDLLPRDKKDSPRRSTAGRP